MPWFRVDDDLALHPKAIAAGNAALGLWVRAGAYAAQYLTEGRVPTGILAVLGGRPRDAAALVAAGLWEVTDDGWRFHQWEERQPTRAQVEADRKAAAERQRRARQRARDRRDGIDPEPEPDPDDDPPNPTDAPDRTTEVTDHVTRDSRSPRPGPAQTPSLLTYVGRLAGGNARDADGLPAETVAAWQDRAGADVDLVAEARAYLAWAGDRPARNPRAAWLGWLDKARERAASTAAAEDRRAACDDPECSGGWLAPVDDRPRPCRTCRPHIRPAEEAS